MVSVFVLFVCFFFKFQDILDNVAIGGMVGEGGGGLLSLRLTIF